MLSNLCERRLYGREGVTHLPTAHAGGKSKGDGGSRPAEGTENTFLLVPAWLGFKKGEWERGTTLVTPYSTVKVDEWGITKGGATRGHLCGGAGTETKF